MPYYASTPDWAGVIVGPFQNLWGTVAGFVPSLIAALVVFIVGLIVATGLGALVEKIFEAVKLDKLLRSLGVEPYFHRAGLHLRSGHFFGQIVFWFFVLAFLLAASDILGLFALSSFLRDVLAYIPNIVVAVLIMLAAVVIANFLRRLVNASVKSANLPSAHFLGTLVWWVIVVFGFFATLNQLRIAETVVTSLITGFIAMLALAGGLAFGLGGKEYAGHLINRLREHTESR